MRDHWLVIGASSAIARAFAREAARRGAFLTLAGRDLAELEASARDAVLRGAAAARALKCDVADAESRAACIASASVPDSTLNVLLAAGQMPAQEEMETQPALLGSMIDATYAGPAALIQALVPLFERQHGGRIVIIGSVAGDRGRRKNYLYGSAKAGLATFAEGLRARLHRAGSTVTLVKPGFVDTSMTWGMPGLFLVASPEGCALAAMRAAERGRASLYYPFFWGLIMLVIRCLPAAVLKRLNF
jgi:short-subunit dehydrogenase